jgi:hypothetical protein
VAPALAPAQVLAVLADPALAPALAVLASPVQKAKAPALAPAQVLATPFWWIWFNQVLLPVNGKATGSICSVLKIRHFSNHRFHECFIDLSDAVML